MKSRELFERAKLVSPGGVHSPVRSFNSVGGTPIFFETAQGAMMTDVDGNQYIDYCQSFGPLLFGHRDETISKTVRETVDMAWSFGACEPYSLELAEFLVSRIPFIDKIRFVNSGTESVMSALRVARAATKRHKILKFDGCYHGHLDALLVKAGSGLAGESSSDSAGIGSEIIANTLVLPLDDEEALEKLFEREGDQIAAVAIEPLPANYGLLIQRKEFIEKVAKLSRKYGALLLFDEVISGFRVSPLGMAGDLGIEPDLVCYGKIIGGGFPVGAYAGKSQYMDLVAPQGPVYQAGTLSANPFGMRAGLAMMQKIWQEQPYDLLSKSCKELMNGLVRILNLYARIDEKTNTIFSQNKNYISEIEWESVTYGSLFWLKQKTEQPVRSIDAIPIGHKQRFARIFHALLNQGIYLAPSGYEVGFLSTAHTKSIIDDTLDKAENAIKKEFGK
ncbi:glutamate-1-semialdehyde 2,1-aminomutase [Leptospira sp. GIMC2001]|uniref:glutamate-1-semialdehyde 2,1-aminomutase n=1 Tax=Leptospira sp. GIMC2001 TaxID=1513297 RepID=UPI00234B8520|nr:glutamate-1-semialdehyde 2,1-aminomutase [Leptospira sp. GIMC2001]WCL49387.1 glutamate-1-semialdehyde 2,1-aminomutase [Leptospira sp. GIMC2001]